MNDEFRNEFLNKIIKFVPNEYLQRIADSLDITSIGYDITKKTTDIVEYSYSKPRELKWFLDEYKIRSQSNGTVYNYGKILNIFFDAIRKPIADVRPEEIKAFLIWYQEDRKVKDVTIDKVRQVICTFFKWCVDNDYISKNPARNVPKTKCEVKPRIALTAYELEKVRNACNTLREKAIVDFLYASGCRVSELCILKKSDVDFNNKTVHLFGKGRKHRTSAFNDESKLSLEKYLESRTDDSEYLFVNTFSSALPIKRGEVEYIIKNIALRSGIDKKVTPHIFRHTMATTGLSNGMAITSIQALLGHSSINTTLNYAKVNQEQVIGEYRKAVL